MTSGVEALPSGQMLYSVVPGNISPAFELGGIFPVPTDEEAGVQSSGPELGAGKRDSQHARVHFCISPPRLLPLTTKEYANKVCGQPSYFLCPALQTRASLPGPHGRENLSPRSERTYFQIRNHSNIMSSTEGVDI